jgi:hypothetical protein
MVSITNVSTYELLVKPIVDSPSSPNRTVIQGYFLTISNPTLSDLTLRLTFKALTPDFDSSQLIAFWDVNNTNNELSPVLNLPCARSYTFDLPALDTGLFLLQPDIRQSSVLTSRNTEIRGYVRLGIDSATAVPGSGNTRTLLLAAQQRGTFLPQGNTTPPAAGDFDQLAYSLPLASGGSEVTLMAGTVPAASATLAMPGRASLLKAIETNPTFLSEITNEPLAQQLAELSVEEQQRMLYILLERFQGNPQIIQPNNPVRLETNGNLVNEVRPSLDAGALR